MSLYVEGDVPYVANGNCNNSWNDWSWIIALALIGGLGNGGFGFGGGFGGFGRGGFGYGAPENYVLATDFATIERKIDGVNAGICDSTFALNNTINNGFFGVQSSLTQGFAGLNTAINAGFAGVDRAVCTLGYQQAELANGISHQISDCCCATQRAIDGVKFENCQNTSAIINAINAGNQRLVDIYTNDKLEALRAENTALKGRLSDDYQADRIISKLSPCPSPAYIVPNPNCCYQYNVNPVSNCGCGCGV